MKEAIASPKQSHSAVRHNTDLVSRSTRNYAVTPRKKVDILRWHHCFSPGNGVWGSSVEFPYWWRVTTQIWVVFVIRWSELSTTQKHHWSTTQIWVVTRHQYGISALLPRSDIISRGNQWWRREMTTVNFLFPDIFFVSIIIRQALCADPNSDAGPFQTGVDYIRVENVCGFPSRQRQQERAIIFCLKM